MNRKRIFLLMLPWRWLVVAILALVPGVVQAQSSFYRPKSLIIPLHDQKNQLHLSVGKGGGYDFNVSYAFTNKLAIFSTATFDNFTKRNPGIYSHEYFYKRNDHVLRGGLGYFTTTRIKHLSVFEFYAGAGTSKINNYSYHINTPDYRDITQARYQTVYLQANVGENQAKWLDFAFGTRIACSSYSDFSFYRPDPTPYITSTISGSYNNLWGVTAEPVFSLGFKFNGFKLDGQFGAAIFLFGPKVDNKYEAWGDEDTIVLDALLGRISLQYNLNFRKREAATL